MKTTKNSLKPEMRSNSKRGSISKRHDKTKEKQNATVKKPHNSLPKDKRKRSHKRVYKTRPNVFQKNVPVPLAIERNKMEGIANGDCRYTTDASAFQYQPRAFNVDKGIDVNPTLNFEAVQGIALALIQKALLKGWSEDIYPNDPINAGEFITRMLLNSAAGGEPITQHVPCYLGVIQHAISPKNITYEKQLFNYAFKDVPSNPNFGSEFTYGSPGTMGKITIGQIDNTNSGPLGLSLISSSTVSDDLNVQAQAYVRLTQHLAAHDDTNKRKAHLPILAEDIEWLRNTASAFSAPTITYGNAYGSSGGDVVRLGNETPVSPEVLGVFATPTPNFASAGRAPNCNSSRGGGSMEAMLFASAHPPQQLAKLTRPVLKYINFNNLFYVYCKTLEMAIQLYANDPEAVLATSVNRANIRLFKNTVLPNVTMLEAALAFRNTLMMAFSRTQWASCALTPTNATSESFIGYAGGVGAYPVPLSSPLQMSVVLLENIRALLGRSSRTDDGCYRWFIPVLGQYSDDQFADEDFKVYTNNVDGERQAEPLFNARSTREKKKDEKKDEKKNFKNVGSPNVFVKNDSKEKVDKIKGNFVFDINLWDGGSQQGFVAINNEEFLQAVTNELNRSYTSVSKYVQTRSTFSSSPPANDLCQLGSTFYLKRNGDGETTGYGTNYTVVRVSYGYQPDADVIDEFVFVPPTRLVSYGESLTDDSEINVVASTNLETTINQTTSGPVGLNWREYLDSCAALGVGAGSQSNVVRALNRLSAKGKGGIASDILSGIMGVANVAAPLIGKGIDMFV